MNYIDLTMSYEAGMRGFSIDSAKVLKEDGWNATNLNLYSHAGTHMDAPLHFEVNQKTIDQYSPSRFFCDCWLIDLPNCKPSQLIKPEDIGAIAKQISSGEGLVFRTGWSEYLGQDIYRNQLPGISKELAEWCAEKGVAMIAVESPSIADVNNLEELNEVHTILLKADVIIIEGLCNLDKIKADKIKLVALPLKIKGGDGAPCRVIAIEK
jgi:arylformamidase